MAKISQKYGFICSTLHLLLSPCDLSLVHTVLFQQYRQKPNKPSGLFLDFYPQLLDSMSLVKIPSSTFFLLFFLFSLHWHFLKCFLQVSAPERWEPKEYLWAIKLAKHWCLRRFLILISLLKSLWSLTVNLHNHGDSKVSKLFEL